MSAQKKLKIHFIGIGGIGVSALAQYYLAKGHRVSGSDLASSEIIQSLKKKGVKISLGQHKRKNLPRGTDLVIYSPAVKGDNPELLPGAKSYPQALGELTKEYFTVAVSGTHGKSTTAAMIGLIMVKAGLDPTVIVGTKVKEFNDSNCRVGKGKYLVIEADEHFASFLNYWPNVIVLTNIEEDHLDYYKNLKNVLKTYREYLGHLPEDGVLIVNKDDKNSRSLIKSVSASTKYFSTRQKEANKLKRILKVSGGYNVANALAALTLVRVLKVPDRKSFKALSDYRGAWRRFEIRQKGQLTVVSDYGHHPTEIKAALKAAREKWPDREIWCVFQPHQYQRTHYLFKDFVKVFSRTPVNKVFITDIYDVAGRENKTIKKKVSSEKLVGAVKKPEVSYLAKNKIIDYLKNNLWGREVVIFMGAGDIYEVDKTFN